MNKTKNKAQEKKKKNNGISSQNFKKNYFDFYDDIKTNPRQDW